MLSLISAFPTVGLRITSRVDDVVCFPLHFQLKPYREEEAAGEISVAV